MKKRKRAKGKKWRRLYSYICRLCNKRRRALLFDRYVGMKCRVCTKNKVPDNQPSLFSEVALSHFTDPTITPGNITMAADTGKTEEDYREFRTLLAEAGEELKKGQAVWVDEKGKIRPVKPPKEIIY